MVPNAGSRFNSRSFEYEMTSNEIISELLPNHFEIISKLTYIDAILLFKTRFYWLRYELRILNKSLAI